MRKLTSDGSREITVTATGEEVLVHDGKRVHVRSAKGTTGVGNPALEVLVGTPEEIAAEVKRLGLRDDDALMDG